jgi:sterol desaturase/sphingolipid hydroxylase (fatty acid hydroxylase superfamily)
MSTHDATVRRNDVLKASPRMFENPVLDKLSRVHPSVPVIVFVPVIGVLLGFGIDRVGVGASVLWVLGGIVFWTLTEYWLHRLVFHFEPDHPLGRRLHFIIHGVHHDHPNDRMRLVMPPSVSVPLAALFLLGFHAVLGDGWLAFGAGFLAGYLTYDMTHYHVHHHKPKTALGKRLREQHMRHHFQDHDRGYGVSSPIWDYVFGTVPLRRTERTARAK